MDRYETFALDHYLSEYPKDWGFERILDTIESRAEEVGVWEPFEHFTPDVVASMVDGMVEALRQSFPYAGAIHTEVPS